MAYMILVAEKVKKKYVRCHVQTVMIAQSKQVVICDLPQE